MSEQVNDVAPEVIPPIVEAVEAAVQTVAAPTPANVLADVTLAISIINNLKAHLDSKHPSIWDTIKALF